MRLKAGRHGHEAAFGDPVAQIVDGVGSDAELEEMQCHDTRDSRSRLRVKGRGVAGGLCSTVSMGMGLRFVILVLGDVVVVILDRRDRGKAAALRRRRPGDLDRDPLVANRRLLR